jgi:di/tricarboxylate transporter
MSHATISFVILGAAMVLFVLNRLPPEIVALAAALALYATGVLQSDQVLAGFGDPAVAFIASLVTTEGDLVVLAIQHRGEDRNGDTALEAGDTLLLQGDWEALDETLEDPEVLVVEDPRLVRRQAVRWAGEPSA